MGKVKGCANCGRATVWASTLCVDCLAACNVRVLNENLSLQAQTKIANANAAVIISEKNKEIENLKYQLKLNQKILRHIFREYQELQKLKAVDIVV